MKDTRKLIYHGRVFEVFLILIAPVSGLWTKEGSP